MTDALFDATPYGPAKAARKAQTPPAVAETVPAIGYHWKGISRSTPGVVHCVVGSKEDRYGRVIAGAVSACGVIVVAHTYGEDEIKQGCAECAARVKGS